MSLSLEFSTFHSFDKSKLGAPRVGISFFQHLWVKAISLGFAKFLGLLL